VLFIQLAVSANRSDRPDQGFTVFLLGDEVLLGFDAGLEGVQVLSLVLLDIRRHSLQDVVGGRRPAARAALGAAGLRHHVGVVTRDLVFLGRETSDRKETSKTRYGTCISCGVGLLIMTGTYSPITD